MRFLAAPALLSAGLGIAACGDQAPIGGRGDPGGQGGAGSGGGGVGAGGDAALCADGRVGLAGAIDGQELSGSFAWMLSSFRGDLFQTFFQTRGRAVLFGDQEEFPPEGTMVAAQGLLRLPAEAPSAGDWFCAAAGSSVTRGEAKDLFRVESLSRLGACPGTPVAGEVTACLGGGIGFCPQGTRLESTLEGASFDWSSSIVGWGGSIGLYEVRLDNGGVLTLDIDLDTVQGGLLLIAAGSPDEGAAYCFGGGGLEPGPDNAIRFTLGGLSRLGVCPGTAVDGALDGCIQ